MPEAEAILEADNLRVVFFRSGDRYAHRFDVFDADRGEWAPNYESLEGASDEAWPPSPPFQSLHVERRPTGDVVLLVGMAGKTHWSAAVERSRDGRGISFDVAARYQAVPQRLGSEYAATAGEKQSAIVMFAATGKIENRSIRPAGALSAPPATACWKYVVMPSDAA